MRSQRLNAWADFGGFSVGLGRWLLGGDPPSGVQATIDRRGGEGVVRIELDPDRARDGAGDTRTATAMIVAPGSEASSRLDLRWVGEDALEARFPLHRAGTYFGAVQLPNGEALPLAPLSLPYSPEYEPRPDPGDGHKTLSEMARITGGAERTSWGDVFAGTGTRNRQIRDLILPLTLVLLLLHVGEIAGRRLLAFDAATAWLSARRLPWRRQRSKGVGGVFAPVTLDATGASPVASDRGSVSSETSPRAGGGEADAPSAPSAPSESALARAKARAKSRLGE